MDAKAILYIRLTKTEVKSINLENKSDGGSSQTYIDIPKGQVSDKDMINFFGEPSSGLWKVDVYSLGNGIRHQTVEIYSRRGTTNSIRNQANNRVYSWNEEGFPKSSEGYDEKGNPVIIYFIKDTSDRIWAGWFYLKNFTNRWYLNIELAQVIFNKDRSGYINLTSPVSFSKEDLHWPFMSVEPNVKKQNDEDVKPLQIIYYGAPGTGKSYAIKEETKGKDVVRTTFHPDSDYSTFVGAYKPTMDDKERYADSGLLVKYQEDKENHRKGDPIKEKEIVYKFVPQAFLKAYVGAWQKYCDNQKDSKPQYLVVEEINRGNCAQIFGDLFQLLDRNDYGFSEYPISADSDISKYIQEEFKRLELSIADHNIINSMYNDDVVDKDVAQKMLNGEILLLPSNLYIWATMNTSDQSLFPIDSAFKRRWEWRYVRISNAIKKDKGGNVLRDASGKPLHYNWVIKVGEYEYDWWSFLQKVNDEVIYKLTTSEDKKLGYFFCKANDGIINVETFTNKVFFYLWNEIFKDSPTDNSTWLKNEGDKEHPILTFQSFYKEDDEGMTVINEDAVNAFMKNLGVKYNKETKNTDAQEVAVKSDPSTSETNEQ